MTDVHFAVKTYYSLVLTVATIWILNSGNMAGHATPNHNLFLYCNPKKKKLRYQY